MKAKQPVERDIKRIVREQIDRAIGEIDDPALGRHEAVHQVRKRCKKIRGVLRMVRPALGKTYQVENAWYRDAARELSGLRDAKAMLECYDALLHRFRKQVARPAFAPIRRELTLRRQRATREQRDIPKRLEKFKGNMEEARKRIGDWKISDKEFNALEGGLRKTYRRGLNAMSAAHESTDDARLHEWRKRVKYHRYHLRVLRNLWPPVIRGFWSDVKRLSDLLGDDHDLAVIRQAVLKEPDAFAASRTIQAFLGLMDRHRAQLQAEAWSLGARVFAEKPKQFTQRLGCYWEAWRAQARGRRPRFASRRK